MEPFVRLFGRPQIAGDGRTLVLRAEARCRLLAVLALRRGPIGRDWLAALFWPERSNATARRNLRKLLFDAQAIARLPPAAGIEATRDTLCWRIATDVEDFENAAATNRRQDALALYRGPLLEGLDDPANNALSALIDATRLRLQRTWRGVALAQLNALRAEPHAALVLAHALLAADPLDEEAVAACMTAHLSQGHTSHAARVFVAYRQRLAGALAVEPSPQLCALLPAALRASVRVAPAQLQLQVRKYPS